MRLAAAPISWGACEVPGWGAQLAPERVLADMRELGIDATEAGPPGFLPSDPAQARALLARHGLRIVGGFVTALLHDAARLDDELASVERQARWLQDVDGEVMVLAAASGTAGYDARTALDARGWERLVDGLSRARDIARDAELVTAVHPHFGTAIETAVDIDRLLEASDLSLCLDTGHAVLGGADPVALAERAAERIAHVHLKDVDPTLAPRVRSRELGYLEAVRRGLFRPLGHGAAGIDRVLAALRARGYRGWLVLEQDVALGEADDTDPVDNVRQSLDFVRARA